MCPPVLGARRSMRPRATRGCWRGGRSSAARGAPAPSSSLGHGLLRLTLDLRGRDLAERTAQTFQEGEAVASLLVPATVTLEHGQRDHRGDRYAAPFDDHRLLALPDVAEQAAEILSCCRSGDASRSLRAGHGVSPMCVQVCTGLYTSAPRGP